MIYYIVFSISTMLAWISTNRILNRLISFVFSFFAVFSISILNWIRDVSIGTDLSVYGNYIFELAHNYPYDILTFFKECELFGMAEKGYALLNYVIAQFTNNIHFFYFLVGLIVNTIFYISIFRLREYIPFSIAWCTYLFLLYPSTLNLLRQGLALSLIMLMGSLAITGKYVRAIVCIAFACTFHHSSLFALVIFAFIYMMRRARKTSTNNTFELIFLVLSAMLPAAIQYMNAQGMLSDKYSQYVVEDGGGSAC